MSRPSLAILMAAACLLAAPINADADPSPPSVVVSYADLDLTSEAGAQTLLRRLKHAVRAVCSETRLSIMGLEAERRYTACMSQTLNQSVQAVGSEQLTRLYLGPPATRLVASASPPN